jgi:hypothetical protein
MAIFGNCFSYAIGSMFGSMCAHGFLIWKYSTHNSQLKINHLNNTPSTKAAGGGISVVCLTRTSKYRSKRRSWLVPLLPTFILSCLLASWRNVEDFVDAKFRCNLVNWESIAGSPLQSIPNWNNLRNIIRL